MREKLLVAGVILMALLGFSSRGIARVNINIEVPPLVISAPPAVVVIPGTYVYFSPDVEADLFFYDGYWYRPYEGNWYRSVDYNGPWVYIAYTAAPYPVIHLPTDFRAEAVYAPRIPYRELRGNWRAWHRDKHWDRVGWGRKPGMEENRHYGVAPLVWRAWASNRNRPQPQGAGQSSFLSAARNECST